MFFLRNRRRKAGKPTTRLARHQPKLEQLEDRKLLATFQVLQLGDSGPGSLRQAILDANASPGADRIEFGVAGTILLTSGPLAPLAESVNIDGGTAPGFAGMPVVEIDYQGFGGLRFSPGAAGSAVRSLGHVRAVGAGITIEGGGQVVVRGNFIGLRLDGTTVAANGGNGLDILVSTDNVIGGPAPQDRNIISGNRGHGLFLSSSSGNRILGNLIGTDVSGTVPRGNDLDGVRIEQGSDNLIGHGDAVIGGVTYFNANQVPVQPVTAWQGIRDSDTAGEFLITGTSGNQGLLFDGTIAGVGASFAVNFPNAAATSVSGPDNLADDRLRLVGSYRNADAGQAPVTVNGFLFEGTTADLGQAANYRTVDFPGARFNYVHSTMGGLAVGNHDSPADHGMGGLPLGPGHAFIYDVDRDLFVADIVYPGSKSNTAYGIWHNGGTSYTICGGYSFDVVNNLDDPERPIGHGFLVDYDSLTGLFTHWASFDYPEGVNLVTHFEGISSVEGGVYTLSADSVQIGTGDPVQGSWVSVRRNTDGSFGPALWVNLNFTGLDPATHVTSSNSVIGNQVVGVVFGGENPFPYQATVDTVFQMSNLISANGANGVTVLGSERNRIKANLIGTDVTGTMGLGNARNGVLLTGGARSNTLGGVLPVTLNDPKPPEGNVISDNGQNGVLINGGSRFNSLSGNFVGTDITGLADLGNTLDGVAIVDGSNDNSLIGTFRNQEPFIFFNVLGGNDGNGLRIKDSDRTIIHANYFGLGSDDNTAVGNTLNGVLVEGTSARTQFGGVIPLGSVTAANGQNGVWVKDQASGFLAFNTFAGLGSFTDNPNLGNQLDGFLITSTGSDIVIRTSVVSRNHDDGIEISGQARGVQVVQTIIGLNTPGNAAMGNIGNGVEIGGNARDNVIGGVQTTFSVIPHNGISANGGHGVAVLGNARNNRINFSYIGLSLRGDEAFGNGGAGIFLGNGTRGTTIGSRDVNLRTVVSANLGNGIEINASRDNRVVGTIIGLDGNGVRPFGNRGNGIRVIQGTGNRIGGTAMGEGNTIAFNFANGVRIDSLDKNAIRGNSIFANLLAGIGLAPGANAGRQPPVLTAAVTGPGTVVVRGMVIGRRNTPLVVDFFANFDGDPLNVQGRFYLGSKTVAANSRGVASFTFTAISPPPGAQLYTATVTDLAMNSSAFSNAVEAMF